MTIQQLVHGGAGLTRIAGKAGFVTDVVPLEDIRIEVTEDGGSRFFARPLEVLKPSPHRVSPRCPLFGECGGCDWQHIEYDRQVIYKSGILLEDLRRLGRITIAPESITVVPSNPWNYRGRVQVHADEHGRPGFKARRSDRVVPVTHCPIAGPGINAFFAEAAEEWDSTDRRLSPGSRTIIVDENGRYRAAGSPRDTNGPHNSVSSTNGPHNSVSSTNGPASSAPSDSAPSDSATATVAGTPVQFDLRGFFQSNRAMLEELVRTVTRLLREESPRLVVDLYAGAGLLTVAVLNGARGSGGLGGSGGSSGSGGPAASVSRVVCVESDTRNTPYIESNLRARVSRDLTVTVLEKRVEDALRELKKICPAPAPGEEAECTLLLVDPPRSGLSPVVREWIVGMRFSALLYLSCDSASLARDLAHLQSVYSICEVVLLDFYPQTAHIETLVFLKCAVP